MISDIVTPFSKHSACLVFYPVILSQEYFLHYQLKCVSFPLSLPVYILWSRNRYHTARQSRDRPHNTQLLLCLMVWFCSSCMYFVNIIILSSCKPTQNTEISKEYQTTSYLFVFYWGR